MRLSQRALPRSLAAAVPEAAATEATSIEEMRQAKDELCAVLAPQKEAGGSQEKFVSILEDFMGDYSESAHKGGYTANQFRQLMGSLLKNVAENMKQPYQFDTFHQAIREPFDYHEFGKDFVRPLIMWDQSTSEGLEGLEEVEALIAKGDNVILLANHQTEADPQVLNLLLEQEGKTSFAEKVVFVAGHRVTTDPLAIPFSMGCNLLCIHSKKHIESPPEMKSEKQAQNMKSMAKLQSLLTEGGKCIWVAPSGGRDRPDLTTEDKEFAVTPFDSKSVEMFRLVAAKANKDGTSGDNAGPTTHFYTLAMLTRKLVPPPDKVESALGEKRSAKRGPVSIKLGPEVTDEAAKASLPENAGRPEMKAAFSNLAEAKVTEMYAELLAKEKELTSES